MEKVRPKRINVIGTSGSGKSHFSRKLAQILKAPHIEMDQLHWGPNWSCRTEEEFFFKLSEKVKGDSWVLDGNYNRSLPIKWKNVQTVIWLDFSFQATFIRAIKRAIKRAWTQQELWPGTGNRESFRRSFCSRDSVLWWTIKTHSRNRRTYQKLISDPRFAHINFVRLRSNKQVESYLAEIELLQTAPALQREFQL